jgi:prevent-host-death family protein
MGAREFSSRDFNQDTAAAKRAALEGPVIITDRGEPAHVLLCIADYRRLLGSKSSIVDRLAHAAAAEVEFEAPRALQDGLKPPTF